MQITRKHELSDEAWTEKLRSLDIESGYLYEVADGTRLFVFDYQPIKDYKATIFVISGVAGINHKNEKDVIEILSSNENRVVVIHPRGTGYSDGTRGDISNFRDFVNDYSEVIRNDEDYGSKQHKLLFFGHSMATSVLLAAVENLSNIDGAILVNPPYLQKAAEGMSPSFWQYVKYAPYYLFAKHKPIVNMAGNPAKIENKEDRLESENRANDPLLVKYFSIYYMNEARKLINSMLDRAKKANYPLLLIYGMNDSLVDKKGCDLIYREWKNPNKEYRLIENGSHGKSTVILAKEAISKWIKQVCENVL